MIAADDKAFAQGLYAEGGDVLTEEEAALLDLGADIVSRTKENLPAGAMQTAVRMEEGRGPDGLFIDVGVLPGSGLQTQSGAAPEAVAVAVEFGHLDFGVHVAPRPFFRPGMAQAIAADERRRGA